MFYRNTGSHPSLGEIYTDHGIVKTPNFTPVGTKATVKTLSSQDLSNIDLIFANTYHLYFSPGVKVLEKHGGIHKFMNRKRPIITDSGGFQVFSLGLGNTKNLLNRIKDEGVEFKNPSDGSKHFFSPKVSIGVQKSIGADIILSFDDCTPYKHDFVKYIKNMSNKEFKKLISSILSNIDKSEKAYSKLTSLRNGKIYIPKVFGTSDTLDELFYEYTKFSLRRTHKWSEEGVE